LAGSLPHSSGRSSGFRANGLTRAGLLTESCFFGNQPNDFNQGLLRRLPAGALLLYQLAPSLLLLAVTIYNCYSDYTEFIGFRQPGSATWLQSQISIEKQFAKRESSDQDWS